MAESNAIKSVINIHPMAFIYNSCGVQNKWKFFWSAPRLSCRFMTLESLLCVAALYSGRALHFIKKDEIVQFLQS